MTLENKINKAIKETMVLQYHLAKREQKIDAFEKLFMQKNILGSLTETGLQTLPLFDCKLNCPLYQIFIFLSFLPLSFFPFLLSLHMSTPIYISAFCLFCCFFCKFLVRLLLFLFDCLFYELAGH